MPGPMRIAHLADFGMRSIEVACVCGHHARVDVSGWNPALAIPELRRKLRCSRCGQRPATTTPAWTEYNAPGQGDGSIKDARSYSDESTNKRQRRNGGGG